MLDYKTLKLLLTGKSYGLMAFRTEGLVRHSISFGFWTFQKKISDSALGPSFLRKFSRTHMSSFGNVFSVNCIQFGSSNEMVY